MMKNKRFAPADFLKLLELQRRSVQWLITDKFIGTKLCAVDAKPLANDAIAMLLRLQLCN